MKKVQKSHQKLDFLFPFLGFYRLFHSEMCETKALDGHLKLNFQKLSVYSLAKEIWLLTIAFC